MGQLNKKQTIKNNKTTPPQRIKKKTNLESKLNKKIQLLINLILKCEINEKHY